ncbi:tryptophan synthase subunit alpha, partial [uncultured Helicobacter sp.]
DKSIAEGFTLSAGFELLSTLSNRLSQLQDSPTKLIIVTYANLIFHSGMEKFIKEAKKCGVFGILVPDLPIESDENL